MSAPDADSYGESTERERMRAVPFSHLSIELGHLRMDDLRSGDERIREHFQRIAPWVETARAGVAVRGSPRVSTCFLLDDYFQSETSPAEVVGNLLKVASECNLPIDYLAREAGCWLADGVPLADIAAARLLPEPAPGTNGSRPPTSASGWLCNGERSPQVETDQAMRTPQWRPPVEFSKRHHSIFVDIELWKEEDKLVDGEVASPRTWSCPFLASVWQLLRLGMLRYHGDAVTQPHPWSADMDWPERWGELPAVLKLNRHAAPFAAYRSLSVLPHWYLPIENAVRVILGNLTLDDAVTDQVVDRAAAEGIRVSRSVVDRISHVFVEGQ
ncbi:MAG: SCO2522 family protein [Pseudonocardiaceae bacterium]